MTVIAQYPDIANQSNCAILGGSSVAYSNIVYVPLVLAQYIFDHCMLMVNVSLFAVVKHPFV